MYLDLTKGRLLTCGGDRIVKVSMYSDLHMQLSVIFSETWESTVVSVDIFYRINIRFTRIGEYWS